MLNLHLYFAQRANYAINPTAEQALGSNQIIVPQRVIAALDVVGCHAQVVTHMYWEWCA